MFVYSKRFFYAKFGNLHMVRTSYDDKYDFVNAFDCPYDAGNLNMNYNRCALIDKDVPYEYLFTAFREAEEYKECGDDISPIHVNGYFIGANHGNPNTIDVYTDEHMLDEAAIGEQVCDDEHVYTVIQVQDSSRLLLAYLNGNGQTEVAEVGRTLRFEDPVNKALAGVEIKVKGSCMHMNLRPCGNSRNSAVFGDGEIAQSNRFYDEITVLDNYNILDFCDVVQYLRENTGKNTNRSYFENDIAAALANMSVKHVFDEKGRVSTYHEVEFLKTAHLDFWFGAQQINFTHDETAWFNAPCSEYDKGWHRAKMGTEIRKSGETVPNVFYMADPEIRKGYYLYLDPEYGTGTDECRKDLPKAAKVSEWRTKLYCYAAADQEMAPGTKLALAYSKGPFDPAKSAVENGYFTLNGKKHQAAGLFTSSSFTETAPSGT